ncbi:MAG: hypothetical protein ACI32C_03820 [Candidatus Enteromonas sp.]
MLKPKHLPLLLSTSCLSLFGMGFALFVTGSQVLSLDLSLDVAPVTDLNNAIVINKIDGFNYCPYGFINGGRIENKTTFSIDMSFRLKPIKAVFNPDDAEFYSFSFNMDVTGLFMGFTLSNSGNASLTYTANSSTTPESSFSTEGTFTGVSSSLTEVNAVTVFSMDASSLISSVEGGTFDSVIYQKIKSGLKLHVDIQIGGEQ